MIIFQDPASSNSIIVDNNAYINGSGIVYAANADLNIGSDFTSNFTLYIGKTITITGNGSLLLK